MAATVVSDHSEALLCEKEHLSVPHVGIQGPAVRERNDRASTPVLVVNLGPVFRRNRTHLTSPFSLVLFSYLSSVAKLLSGSGCRLRLRGRNLTHRLPKPILETGFAKLCGTDRH